MINPWKILGVHRQSTPEEIRLAFHDIAKACHPDKLYGHGVRKGVSAALDTFNEANEAYSILKDAKATSSFIKNAMLFCAECPKCKGKGATFKSVGFTQKTFTVCATCGGAGFLIDNKKEEANAIKLQPLKPSGGGRGHNQHGAKANKRRFYRHHVRREGSLRVYTFVREQAY